LNIIELVKYLANTKNDHYLYLKIDNYKKYRYLINILLFFNKGYIPCRIFKKKHKYHINIVVVGLKHYNRVVKRRTNGFSKDFLEKHKNVKCLYCNSDLTNDNATADHIVPVSKMGSNTKVNLVVCCKTCNEERGDEEFYRYLFQKQLKFKKMKYPFI